MAILPAYDQKLYDQVKNFLEQINYVGMANFDIKYDVRDGQYKFFEINLRQGRSSFYVTLTGYNLAKWYVEDYIDKTLADKEVVYGNEDPSKRVLWLGLPKKLFGQYAVDNAAKREADQLLDAGRWGTTVFYDRDKSFMRWLLMKHMYNGYKKRYKTYFEVNKGQFFEKN